MEKSQIKINGNIFCVDKFGYEGTQLDGDEAGRSDDFTMIRDVGGLNNKLYGIFNALDRWYGTELSRLLKLLDLTECELYYFDAKEYKWVTKRMYLTISKIDYIVINDDIYLESPVEIHFIQMDVDEI